MTFSEKNRTVYSIDINTQHEKYVNFIFDKLFIEYKPKTKVKILDVGCGSGLFVKILRNNFGFESFGIDKYTNLNAIDYSLKNYIFNANAHKLPFKDSSFDYIIAHHSLEHFENPNMVLEEINRITKPGGIIFIVVPVIPFGLKTIYHLINLQKNTTHISMLDPKIWEKLFYINGFQLKSNFDGYLYLDPPNIVDSAANNISNYQYWILKIYNSNFSNKLIWRVFTKLTRKSFIFKKQG